MELKFGPVTPAFETKHGKLYCGHCKRQGVRTPATQIPQGWPRSILFKREFATCDAHLDVSRTAALKRIREDRGGDESEADYLLAQRYGI